MATTSPPRRGSPILIGSCRSTNASAATLNALCRAFLQGGYADLRDARVEHRLRPHQPGRRSLWANGTRDRPGAGLHDGDRGGVRGAAPGRLPQQPRGVDPSSTSTRGRIDSRTGNPYNVSGHFLWVGADPAARRRPCGAAVQGEQPDRGQARTHHDPGRRDRSGRQAQPDQPAGSAHVHHPDGLHPGSATCCRTSSRRSPPPVWSPRGDGSDTAAQHVRDVDRLQDPQVRRRDRRGARLRRAPLAGHVARGLHGADGWRRHRASVVARRSTSTRSSLQYESVCDPRLNRTQSLELAFLVAEMLRESKD